MKGRVSYIRRQGVFPPLKKSSADDGGLAADMTNPIRMLRSAPFAAADDDASARHQPAAAARKSMRTPLRALPLDAGDEMPAHRPASVARKSMRTPLRELPADIGDDATAQKLAAAAARKSAGDISRSVDVQALRKGRASLAPVHSPVRQSRCRWIALVLTVVGVLALVAVAAVFGVRLYVTAPEVSSARGSDAAAAVGGSAAAAAAAAAAGISGVGSNATAVSASVTPSASTTASPSASGSTTASLSASGSTTALPSVSGSVTPSATPTSSPLPLPSAVAVASNASSVELWSARMLSERLGFPLRLFQPGVSPLTTSVRAVIAVGHAAALAAGLNPEHLASLREDDFIIANNRSRGLRGGSLAVSSGPLSTARGTMYGAYRLLRELGFGFYTLNVTRVPAARPFSIPPSGVDIVERPPMRMRDMSVAMMQNNVIRVVSPNGTRYFLPVNISAALGLNGPNVNLPAGRPVGLRNEDRPGSVHSAFSLLSPSLWGDDSTCAGPGFPPEPHLHNTPCPQVLREHPEWFICTNTSDAPFMWPCTNTTHANKNNLGQVCWSVPSLQVQMMASVRAAVRLQPDMTDISVAVMDGTPMNCPPDAFLNVQENSTAGAYLHAANAIAANISADLPQLTIHTLAYNGARFPVKQLRQRDNMILRFVPSMNQFESLYHPSNAVALSQAREWARAAPRRHVFDNMDNFGNSLSPWPNYYTLPLHIKEFFAEGFEGYYSAGLQVIGGDMSDLKTFVTARVMWDPVGSNVTALTIEFIEAVYGPAAVPAVRGYMQTMETSFRENDKALDFTGKKNVRGASRRITIWNGVYSNRTIITCGALLKAAEASAPSIAFRDNIRQAMLNVQFIALMRWAQLRIFAGMNNISWPFAATAAGEFQAFNTTFTRTKTYTSMQYDEYPAIASFACDLGCMRGLMLAGL